VGHYGLSYSRTWNSRTPEWRSSSSWWIDDITVATGQTPTYVVNFPDGRKEVFTYSTSDVDYRAAGGVRERPQPWTSTGGINGVCYLVLPDGGKVEFSGTRTLHTDNQLRPPTWYEYEFTATAIIDPYGQRTTFEYNTQGFLSKVTEPAGRSIQIFYTTAGSAPVIDYIRGSDGREVHYTYQTQVYGVVSYPVLTHVAYYGDSTLNASYTYQGSNVGSNGPPLLATCDDVMYDGPMKKIAYSYATGNNPDNTPPVFGQILSEKSSASGPAVSTLTINNSATHRNKSR
jgi:YD repeat-containing protein